MAGPAQLGAIEYAAETAFAETSTTFTTHRLPIIGMVDTSGLTWAKEASGRVEQYRQGGSQHVLMTQGGSVTVTMDLAGHGVSTAGTPSIDALETFLGLVFGNVTVSSTSSTTATAGTAASVTTAASGTIAPGSLVHVGTLGDARGGGQFHAVGTHVTTTLTLLTALGGAPTNGDVIRPAYNIYPSETPSAGLNGTVPGIRFRLLTGNLQYACHGCLPTAVRLSGLNTGERPQIEITFAVSRWDAVSATFPSAVASNQYNPAPVAAGSLFVNTVGTATRAVRSYRNFAIDYTLGMEAIPGPGGVGAYQSIVGCRRTVDSIKVSWTEDADAATASPVLQGYGTGASNLHVLWTGSTTPGSAIAIYLPKVCISNVPVQKMDGNLNRISVEGMAYTGGTTTSELTLSAFRLALA